MSPKRHWTGKPRFRSPNCVLWYHRHPGPLWAPGPAVRMEKQAAAERLKQWHAFNSADYDEEAIEDAALWPCGTYARIQERLRRAAQGRDAINIPVQPWFSPLCFLFACCLPFYGFLIAKLQGAVRFFYGIEGSDSSDCYDGCCSPCVTLVRDEQEIIDRESRFNQRPGSTPYSDPYRSQPRMSAPFSSSPSSSGSQEPPLETIPEVPSRKHSHHRHHRHDTDRPHSISVDPVASSDPTRIRSHTIGKDPIQAPAGPGPQPHELSRDPTSPGQRPPVDHSHHLHHDPKVEQSASPTHNLRQDATIPPRHHHHEHELDHDPTVGQKAIHAHELQHDDKVPQTAPHNHEHELASDQVVNSPHNHEHQLESDRTMSTTPSFLGRLFRSGQSSGEQGSHEHGSHHQGTLEQAPHGLHGIESDQVARAYRPPYAHHLEQDEVVSQPKRTQPHTLGQGAATSSQAHGQVQAADDHLEGNQQAATKAADTGPHHVTH